MIADVNPDGTQILTNVFFALSLVFGAFAVMLWYPPFWDWLPLGAFGYRNRRLWRESALHRRRTRRMSLICAISAVVAGLGLLTIWIVTGRLNLYWS